METMKLDKQPVLFNSTLVCKHDSTLFESNKSAFDPTELKATMNENQTGILCHLKGCGWDADPLASEINDKNGFWNTPELECSMIVDNFTNGNENEVRDSVAPCSIPSELVEDTELYTDKNVLECELPELIVCYKDGTYHVVKDICVDEGVPSEDKILIKNGKDDHNGLCTALPSNGYKNGDITKVSVNTEFLIQDGLKSSSGEYCEKDSPKEYGIKEKVDIDLLMLDGVKSSSEDHIDHESIYECGLDVPKSLLESNSDHDAGSACGPEDPMQTSEENCNATDKKTDDALREEFVSNNMDSVQELHTETSLRSLLESSDKGGNDVEPESGQISYVEAMLKNPDEESNNSGLTNDLSYASKVESGTITYNFDSGKPAASTVDESPENVCEQTLESQNVSIQEGGISDNVSAASQVQRGEGESSFSVAGPLTGLITYSGPIAYSGSISLRSDSSTTSTRSFAFPILQSDWNSSPVRMVKADRRLFRKHRGWRQGLLCCRF